MCNVLHNIQLSYECRLSVSFAPCALLYSHFAVSIRQGFLHCHLLCTYTAFPVLHLHLSALTFSVHCLRQCVPKFMCHKARLSWGHKSRALILLDWGSHVSILMWGKRRRQPCLVLEEHPHPGLVPELGHLVYECRKHAILEQLLKSLLLV